LTIFARWPSEQPTGVAVAGLWMTPAGRPPTSLGSAHEVLAVSDGVRFEVDPTSLQQTALSLVAAARAVDDLREHPGGLRGRAADAGDAQLADALVGLGSAWGWGLEVLAGEVRRWGALLQAAGGLYDRADRVPR
jgi:hypothetical protein